MGKSNKKRYKEHNIEHQIVIDEKYMLQKYNNDQTPTKLNDEVEETAAADLTNQKSPIVLQERSTEGKKKK